jgi:predicted permease
MKNAYRQLLKSPGFTIVSLVTLALGIGLNANAFTVLNRLLLQSLPFRDPSGLIMVWGSSPKAQEMQQSPGDYLDERDQNTVFDGLAAYYVNGSSSLVDPGKVAEHATILQCTANFFTVMGISPVLGRAFTAEEEAGHESVALVSYAYWQKNFAGDPHVLGHMFRLNGTTVTVVGVAPPSLDDPELLGGRIDLVNLDALDVNRGFRDFGWYNVTGRLKPGVTRARAQAEMDAIAKKLAHDFPKTNAERGLRVAPVPTDSEGDIGRHIIWMIMALALAVLMIACVNLANLQLVRTTARAREIAIRLALGSSRLRIMGMLLSESVLLSLCGGALGLLVAKWGNDYIGAYFNIPLPLNYRVLAFAFAASAATGAIFGTLPAWMAARADVNTTLKQGGRGAAGGSRNRLRQWLIIAQLAVALTLLTGAGYFIRGIHRITHREMGWDPDRVAMGMIELPNARYGEHGDKRTLAFGEKLLVSLSQVPGVEKAVISENSPIFGVYAGEPFAVEGAPPPRKGSEPLASSNRITPGFFAAYGMHVLRGRDFSGTDRPGSQNVAIVSRSLAEKFWPGEDPLGKRIGGTDPLKPEWCEVVGVVNDVSGPISVPQYESHYQIYRPWFQSTFRFMTFTLSTSSDPNTLVQGARQAMAKIEPDIAATVLAPARETMARGLSGLSLVRGMLTVMALLGLLLSVIGIYGVVANLASERTQEIGVRMALGAGSADVQWLFMRSGIRLAALGSGIGLLGSLGLIKALDRMVEVIPGNDPWVVAGVGAMLALIALLACWIPAWRATKVDPTVSLRAE